MSLIEHHDSFELVFLTEAPLDDLCEAFGAGKHGVSDKEASLSHILLLEVTRCPRLV